MANQIQATEIMFNLTDLIVEINNIDGDLRLMLAKPSFNNLSEEDEAKITSGISNVIDRLTELNHRIKGTE